MENTPPKNVNLSYVDIQPAVIFEHFRLGVEICRRTCAYDSNAPRMLPILSAPFQQRIRGICLEIALDDMSGAEGFDKPENEILA